MIVGETFEFGAISTGCARWRC